MRPVWRTMRPLVQQAQRPSSIVYLRISCALSHLASRRKLVVWLARAVRAAGTTLASQDVAKPHVYASCGEVITWRRHTATSTMTSFAMPVRRKSTARLAPRNGSSPSDLRATNLLHVQTHQTLGGCTHLEAAIAGRLATSSTLPKRFTGLLQ